MILLESKASHRRIIELHKCMDDRCINFSVEDIQDITIALLEIFVIKNQTGP